MFVESRVAVRVFLLFILMAVSVFCDDDEKDVSGSNGIVMRAKKQGARIDCWRQLNGNGTTGKITFNFESLTEILANGDSVSDDKGQGPKKKHSYDKFISQRFESTGPSDTTLPYSDGISASCLKLSSTLNDISEATYIEINLCLTKKNGTLYLGDENSTVAEGQLKLTVVISQWSFSNQTAYLDLKLNVKIPPGHAIKDNESDQRGPKKFSFGSDASAIFSKQVRVDGTWRQMATGYPKYEGKGANNYFTIRFPSFNRTAEYDPTIDPGTEPDSGSSKGSITIQPSVLPSVVFAVVAVIRSMM